MMQLIIVTKENIGRQFWPNPDRRIAGSLEAVMLPKMSVLGVEGV